LPLAHSPALAPRGFGHRSADHAAKTGSQYSMLRLAAVAADFLMATAHRPFVAIGVYAAFAACASAGLLLIALVFERWLLAMAALLTGVGATVTIAVAMVGEYVQRLYVLETRPLYRVRDDERPNAGAANAGTDGQPTRL
jgi:hypothetical protein